VTTTAVAVVTDLFV